MRRWGVGLMQMITLLCIGVVSCHFASGETIPAFDTATHASSSVTNAEGFIYSSSAKSTMVSSDNSPARLQYSVNLESLNNSSGFTAGMVKTELITSSREARDTYLNASSRTEWSDIFRVSGEVRKVMKNFDYTSGIKI